jgi:purine nucleosidase
MAANEPLPVVLDCDTGVDDAMAIFYGLLAPEIEVVAIGCVWGNTWVETTTANSLRLLEIVDRPRVPVAKGAGKPLIGPVFELGTDVHGEDGQGNTNLPPPSLRPSGESAAEQLVRLAHERPGELTLVPVGPLTNIATALALDPGIAQLYKEVVLMGGAFLVPGNASRVGEANVWHDPEATQIVLEAGWPITIVGLDVTRKAQLTQPLLDELRASGTPAGRHLHRITDFYLSYYEATYGRRECAMHDALALAIAADRSLALRAPAARVDVELAGSHTRGMTVADLRPTPDGEPNARVVLEADTDRFLERWMAVLSGSAPARERENAARS